MSDEGPPKKKQAAGAPAWLVTFSDLMSLLLAFFVLLLTFAEMDSTKFKKVIESLENAFGVQSQLILADIPLGSHIIVQKYSPGTPDTSTVQGDKNSTTENTIETPKPQTKNTTVLGAELAEELENEIVSGIVDLETIEDKVIVRIQEEGSFDSGSATLKQSFLPVIAKIAMILADTPVLIQVAGFTDNVPIQTDMFRSNWELSALRAYSVLNEILRVKKNDPRRFTLEGHAANHPIVKNNSAQNRAKNRRVELIISQVPPKAAAKKELIHIEQDYDFQMNMPNVDAIQENMESTLPPSDLDDSVGLDPIEDSMPNSNLNGDSLTDSKDK